MASSSSSPAAFDQQRPLKRPRSAQDGQQAPPGQVIDHIFIADGVTSTKKAGVKKTPLSCCECRRLKLKCDRNFPCASCKKRGCAEICPTGVLVSGKGTRFILANTEQLHGKIHEMSERIRVLEDALGSAHRKYEGHIRSCPSQEQYAGVDDEEVEDQIPSHPLLKQELLNVKSTMGLYTASGASGSSQGNTKRPELASGQRSGGQAMDVDPSSDRERASSEDTITVPDVHTGDQRILKNGTSRPSSSHLSGQVARFSNAFPVSSPLLAYSPTSEVQGTRRKDDYKNLALREYIRGQLPSREEAEYLWGQANRNALWQYDPHSSPTFFTILINHVYTSSVTELCTRRLALLLMILAVGCHVDLNERPGQHPNDKSDIEEKSQIAELYHQLGRASLCEIPIMEETNVDVVLALFWEMWYLLVFSDKKKSAGYAWGLMGLTVKLTQSIGLHRNTGKVKVIPEEVEKRRFLFWELLSLDARLSLSLGRPPSLTLNHVDSERPAYLPGEGVDLANSLHHYQEWSHTFYIHCMTPVLEAISQPSSNLDYQSFLDLDRRIRDFPIPEYLKHCNGYESRALMMQKGAVSMALETVLLQLHRTFFIRAVSGFDEAFNRTHRFAPSVVAVFLSASRMIAAVQDLYRREPQLTSRILGFWSNAFSCAFALSVLVCRAPFTCLTPAALQELERARILFRTAKDICPRALQVLPIMESMVDKANDIYNRWLTGHDIPTMILRHTIDGGKTPNGPPPDPFAPAHSSLAQCIVEAHERARILSPLRKPCACSASVAKHCPPSHSWAPPPEISTQHPVLPGEAPVLYTKGAYNSFSRATGYENGHHARSHPSNMPPAWGEGLYSRTLLPRDGPALPIPPPISSTISPASKMAVFDTLNFDLGAINSSSEQNWIAFF